MDLARYPRATKAAKTLVPQIGRVLSGGAMQSALSFCETGAAVLQGKGSGSGWNMSSEVRAALRFIPEGGMVLDIGANRGDWSRHVQRFRDNLGVFLFEPQSSCRPYLEDLIAAGATLVPSALGEQEGTAQLMCPGDGSGIASLHERRDSYFDGMAYVSEVVQVTTLDRFIATHKLPSIAFAKFDIEGHELAALRGAKDALAGHKIKALSFEFGSSNLNSRTYFHDFWDLLTGYGYRISRILPSGALRPLTRYSETLEYFRGATNYLAALPQ